MAYLVTGAIIFLTLMTLGVVSIRKAYRNFCIKVEYQEKIEIYRNNISEAKKYFKTTYSTDFDTSVYDNVKIKTDFIMQLIDKKEGQYEKQLFYYDKLYKMLYETACRLKTNYDDVRYITGPLNGLQEEIVEEHIDYLKRMTEGLS